MYLSGRGHCRRKQNKKIQQPLNLKGSEQQLGKVHLAEHHFIARGTARKKKKTQREEKKTSGLENPPNPGLRWIQYHRRRRQSLTCYFWQTWLPLGVHFFQYHHLQSQILEESLSNQSWWLIPAGFDSSQPLHISPLITLGASALMGTGTNLISCYPLDALIISTISDWQWSCYLLMVHDRWNSEYNDAIITALDGYLWRR